MSSQALSFLPVFLVSAAVVVSGALRSPGAGILLALIVVGFTVWRRGGGLAPLGLVSPQSWGATVVAAALLGALIALASSLLIEPLADRLTGQAHDHSAFDSVRGNPKMLLMWLAIVWVLVALVEEVLFRGFLMTELCRLTGREGPGLILSLALSSVLFGLAHLYQGKAGALSTGVIGLILGVVFIRSQFNLWLPILTHGFIDTVGLTLIYLNGDVYLKRLFGGA